MEFEQFKPKLLKLSQDKLNVEVEKVMGTEQVRIMQLEEIKKYNVTFNSVDFEKDDDTNFHIEFIWATANMRCTNYGIEQCDRMKAKLISGKIIPAIATTTAMVAGLVMLEFVKALCYKRLKIDHFRNSFCCLASPLWLQSEPLPSKPTTDKDYDPVVGGPVRALPPNFTVWDKVHINAPNGTVQVVVDTIRQKFSIQVLILSAGNTCIYNSFMPTHQKDRLRQPVTQVCV